VLTKSLKTPLDQWKQKGLQKKRKYAVWLPKVQLLKIKAEPCEIISRAVLGYNIRLWIPNTYRPSNTILQGLARKPREPFFRWIYKGMFLLGRHFWEHSSPTFYLLTNYPNFQRERFVCIRNWCFPWFYYTVQIGIFKNPKDPSFFNCPITIEEHITDVGEYRYTCGKYFTFKEAKAVCKAIRLHGLNTPYISRTIRRTEFQ
jgi:hypothetical protein